MNISPTNPLKAFADAHHEAEYLARAARLRHDWHLREAVTQYVQRWTPPGITAEELLAPYAYLDRVPKDAFNWPKDEGYLG